MMQSRITLDQQQLYRICTTLAQLGQQVVIIDDTIFVVIEFNVADNNTPYIDLVGKDVTRIVNDVATNQQITLTTDSNIESTINVFTPIIQRINRVMQTKMRFSSDHKWKHFVEVL